MKHLSTEERHNLWKKEHDLAEKLIRMRRELRQGHHDQMQEKRDRAREDQVRKYTVVAKEQSKPVKTDSDEFLAGQTNRRAFFYIGFKNEMSLLFF